MRQNRSPSLLVQITSFKCTFIHVSQLTRWPLYVSPFLSSTSCANGTRAGRTRRRKWMMSGGACQRRERRKKASRPIFVDAGRSIRARSPASRAARAPCRDTAEARDARAGARETKRRLDVPWGGPGTSSAARGAASRAVVVLDCGTRPITRAAGESVSDRWGLTARRAGAPFAIERLGSSRTIEDAGSVSPSRRARWRVATPRGRARLPQQSRISREGQKTPARSISRPLGFSLCARQQRQSGSRGVRPRLGA